VARARLHCEQRPKRSSELTASGPDTREQGDGFAVVRAYRVPPQRDTTEHVGRSDSGMHAKRHIRISNFVFVIGEIADGLGSFQ
jgi:hypothetical protein